MSVTVPASDKAGRAAEPAAPLDATLAPASDNHAARSIKLGLGTLSVYGSGALVLRLPRTVRDRRR